jgi:K+-transporting ATPase KdpF subunit
MMDTWIIGGVVAFCLLGYLVRSLLMAEEL